MSQPHIPLNDGTSAPWLAFGTGTALYKQDAANSVRSAIETGIRHLDGAQLYDNEDTLGDGIKASNVPRSELYIVTKLKESIPDGATPKTMLLESLKKLKVDYVDLYLIHSPHIAAQQGKLKEWWASMEEVKNEGLAKSIGVSNFRVEDLKVILEDAKVVPAANQIELHPYVWKAARPIVEFCKEKGIVVESYGGLTPVARVPDGPVQPVITSIADRLSKEAGKSVSLGQVLTKWLLQIGVIVVTTSSKVSRIQEAIAVSGLPDLTAEEIKSIEDEGFKLHKRIFMKHVFGE
ncbi:Aldo/keto reductase [Dendrothele bispora CBS 962.96]|uniref:Aldo/keto reductase n=1 Tax=Dendrothele bispora (strain CBS 962.96) TaxID=1314807 RepID=A0A4S8KYW4_DENBC|nr:Aldo/keto reductase [Dendrothele bispora CBS 962.96]